MKKIITREIIAQKIDDLISERISIGDFGEEMFQYLAFDDKYELEKGFEKLIEGILEQFIDMHDAGKKNPGYTPYIPPRERLIELKKTLESQLMNDEKLKGIIKELDESVPKDGSVVQFDIYGGGVDESFVQANQRGYLRLGIEFLKAAFSPTEEKAKSENKNIIDLDIEYLTSEKSPIRFDWFERSENISPPTSPVKPGGFKDAVLLLGCGIVLFIVMFVFILGIGTIWGWFK